LRNVPAALEVLAPIFQFRQPKNTCGAIELMKFNPTLFSQLHKASEQKKIISMSIYSITHFKLAGTTITTGQSVGS